MKKTLVALFSLVALTISVQTSQAACSCQSSCPCQSACTCNYTNCCCEDWLCPQSLEDYLCRIGLSECQKDSARSAVEEFKCKTQAIRDNGCKCESKCECRAYRRALRDLDCKMKTLITQCQKDDYKCVRKEIKEKVKCCHRCLINPFKRCKCKCNS